MAEGPSCTFGVESEGEHKVTAARGGGGDEESKEQGSRNSMAGAGGGKWPTPVLVSRDGASVIVSGTQEFGMCQVCLAAWHS